LPNSYEYYRELAELIKFPQMEIARRVDKTAKTVEAVLYRRWPNQHFSKETEKAIFRVIEDEAQRLYGDLKKNLSRLSGGATGE
jgi:hypothetical protein